MTDTQTLIPYDEAYYAGHYTALRDPAYYARIAEYWRRIWFAGYPSEASTSVFEYGIGLGANVAWSSAAAGFDVSPFAREFCRAKGIRVFDSMTDVPDSQYRYVISSHVLEHVDCPLESVREMRRVCAPGGVVLLIVPWERHRPSSFEPDRDAHLYSWNFRTLNNLVLRAGGLSIEDNRVLFGPTGLNALRGIERRIGRDRYYALVQRLGRFRNNFRSIRVAARRVS
jgi:SAM-dependent methyltransferase